MLLDKTQLLYALFLVLNRALMLVLSFLCGQHSFFYHIVYRKAFYANFLFFSGKKDKSLCKLCNFLGYLISTSRINPILL